MTEEKFVHFVDSRLYQQIYDNLEAERMKLVQRIREIESMQQGLQRAAMVTQRKIDENQQQENEKDAQDADKDRNDLAGRLSGADDRFRGSGSAGGSGLAGE